MWMAVVPWSPDGNQDVHLVARILIAGAGKLGFPLAEFLSRAGHEISAIRRSAPPQEGPAIHWYCLDLEDADTLSQLDDKFDQVIIILTPASRSPDGYHRIYQTALRNLLQRLDHPRGRPACVFVSATSVYAQNDGSQVDECSPTEPVSYNGRSLLQAENTILEWSPNPLIIRFAGIYGPQRNRLLKQLERPMEIQRTPPTYTNRIHQDDCVAILQFLAGQQLTGQNQHRIYIGADNCPAPKFEMMDWLARASGLTPPTPLDLPKGVDTITQNKRCGNRRLLEAGYRLHYPDYRSGYQSLLNAGQH